MTAHQDEHGSTQLKRDWLTTGGLGRLIRLPGFPWVIQLALLAWLVALTMAGLGVGAGRSSSELMLLRKTNLTTLAVWGLWWPLMIAAAVVLGRAWCTVCPLELVQRLGDAVARRVGWRRAHLGRLARAGWWVFAGYLVLQLLVAGLSLHRVPHYTALLLLVLPGAALLASVVFAGPRAFCRAFCPAGGLLSVYGRYTPLQLEAKQPATCDRCTARECLRCPSALRPYARQPADGCVLCLECVSHCPPGNLGFGVVAASAPVRRPATLRPAEAAFVLVALGFVTHELIAEVKWLEPIFYTWPTWAAARLPGIGAGWFEALWFLGLFPALGWLLLAGVARVAGHRGDLAGLTLAVAAGAAPVIAVAHIAKSVAKMASWGGFVPLALADPRGLATWERLQAHTLGPPTALLGLAPIGGVMGLATVAAAALAWRGARRWPAAERAAIRSGVAVAAVLYTAVLVIWTWPAR